MEKSESMSSLLEGRESLWLPLLSGSMAPALLPGDELYISPLSRNPRRGEIAVFFREGTFFCHRVLLTLTWRGKRYILEKGDANYSARFISGEKVLGTVRRFRRGEVEIDLTSREETILSRKQAARSFIRLMKWRKS